WAGMRKTKVCRVYFFFFTKIKLFLRHLALFATISVVFAHKFFMNKGFAERFAVNSRKKKNEKGQPRRLSSMINLVEFV
ncbi:MAG: hypothetical protein IJX22_02320, partial [Opitutales bacterium]|nr:hypothetical protein [Opitutales bacterium]